MIFNKFHNQFSRYRNDIREQPKQAANDALGSVTGNVSNRIVGGATAGSIMSLLLDSKSTRKMTAKVAGYGGVTLLSSFAYKAYQNWQLNDQPANAEGINNDAPIVYDKGMVRKSLMTQDFEIKLIKVMIASAKADGHIDAFEQMKIFRALDQTDLSTEIRTALFNLLNRPIDIDAITCEIEGLQQKSEIFLAASLVSQRNHAGNEKFLDQLATSLGLPRDLQHHLFIQSQHAMSEEH